MPPRFHLVQSLRPGDTVALPPGPSRHAQVLRLQPGDAVTLFNGEGGEWRAEITAMGRKQVEVAVGAHDPVDRELPRRITLAVGMPANERMDSLVEKATELGAAAIQPLMCERSVLRLSGERADRKREHWEAVAIAACEQCGRTRVPAIGPVATLERWLAALGSAPETELRVLLSTAEAPGLAGSTNALARTVLLLSGPEGGLSAGEEAAARAAGFAPASLGARVLRADTAPLAALACWSVAFPSR